MFLKSEQFCWFYVAKEIPATHLSLPDFSEFPLLPVVFLYWYKRMHDSLRLLPEKYLHNPRSNQALPLIVGNRKMTDWLPASAVRLHRHPLHTSRFLLSRFPVSVIYVSAPLHRCTDFFLSSPIWLPAQNNYGAACGFLCQYSQKQIHFSYSPSPDFRLLLSVAIPDNIFP